MTYAMTFQHLAGLMVRERFLQLLIPLVAVVLGAGVALVPTVIGKILWAIALLAAALGSLTQYSLQDWSLRTFPHLRPYRDHGFNAVRERARQSGDLQAMLTLDCWAGRAFFASVFGLFLMALVSKFL